MKIISATSLVLVILAAFLYSCSNDKGLLPPKATPISTDACDSIRYSNGIKAILDNNCATSGCHDAGTLQNGFDFSIYTTAQAKALDGRIKARVIDAVFPQTMPPSGKLPQAQLDSIQCWINKGAPF
jgi:hypothetical protein